MSDAPASTCEVFFLSFSEHCIPFFLPDYPTVARTAKAHFKEDAINVDKKKWNGDKVYRIELPHPVPVDQYLTFEHNGREHKIRLEPKDVREQRERSQRRREDGYY